MSDSSQGRRTTRLSKTRTNSDWVMIVTGVTLILIFAAGCFFSVFSDKQVQTARKRGPVKKPEMSQQSQGLFDAPLSRIFGHKKQ
jgi:flagellar basal body-associated protein FliL